MSAFRTAPMRALQALLLCLLIASPPLRLSAETATMVAGKVTKVDMPAGKITISHAPIPNLEMPAMTMVFRVADPKFLSLVRAGDAVAFSAARIDNQFVITAIERR